MPPTRRPSSQRTPRSPQSQRNQPSQRSALTPARSGRLRRRVAYSQNFLRDYRVADQVLERSGIGPDDVVYEIGPGEGVITERLALRCRHVVAVEKDPRLVERLRRRFSGRPNVTIFESDFLDFPLPASRYKVFANVPFNVTAAIVSKLTSARYAPEDVYLGVQKESAQRFMGSPAESLVAVLLKPWFEPAIVHRFSRTDFFPVPGVDVVMLRLRKRGPPLLSPAEATLYRDFVAYGFTAWRPSLRYAYREVFDGQRLAHVGRVLRIDLDTTPSALPFEGWLALYRYFASASDARMRARIAGAEARLRQQQSTLHKVHRTRAAVAAGSQPP